MSNFFKLKYSDQERSTLPPRQRQPWWQRWAWVCAPLLIIGVGLFCYANTFAVPFYFDDLGGIVNNPVVQDFGQIFQIDHYRELGIDEDLRNNLVTRVVTYGTFALNYRLHQLDLPGYHLVNLLIHLLNALQVYLLVRLTTRLLSPAPSATETAKGLHIMAVFAALLFVSHPVQTSAVTYLSQRFTSLSTCFYLLALLTYIGSVIGQTRLHRRLLYGTALGATLLAMYSKEIAFTLPVMIAFYDFAFLPGTRWHRFRRLGPFLLMLLVIPSTVLWLATMSESTGNQALNALDLVNFQDYSLEDYFLTQARVLVTYLRLLIWPAGLNFDYDYPLFTSLANFQVITSMALLAGLFVAGIWLLCRSGATGRSWRLVGFGILWFFVTISISSSFIPLVDLILEYRLYLPSIGLFIAAAASAELLLQKGITRSPCQKRILFSLGLTVIVALSTATVLRNNVWQDKVTFWEDVVTKSPGKKRSHFNLAENYRQEGRIDDALRELAVVESLDGINGAGYFHLATLYSLLGQKEMAKSALDNAIRLDPEEPNFHAAQGHYWLGQGEIEKALLALRRAQALDPDDPYLNDLLLKIEPERSKPAARFDTIEGR